MKPCRLCKYQFAYGQDEMYMAIVADGKIINPEEL